MFAGFVEPLFRQERLREPDSQGRFVATQPNGTLVVSDCPLAVAERQVEALEVRPASFGGIELFRPGETDVGFLVKDVGREHPAQLAPGCGGLGRLKQFLARGLDGFGHFRLGGGEIDGRHLDFLAGIPEVPAGAGECQKGESKRDCAARRQAHRDGPHISGRT